MTGEGRATNHPLGDRDNVCNEDAPRQKKSRSRTVTQRRDEDEASERGNPCTGGFVDMCVGRRWRMKEADKSVLMTKKGGQEGTAGGSEETV